MWATQAPRRSPPLWAEAPCRDSRASLCVQQRHRRREFDGPRAGPAAAARAGAAQSQNPLGDEGLAALLAPPPPPPAGVPLPPTGVLPKLERLDLTGTQVSDAGCAALAAALDNGLWGVITPYGDEL